MSIQQEVWKPVVGFESLYEVSNTGKVRSVTRTYTNSRKQVRTIFGKELKADNKRTKRDTTNQYKRVTLCRNGRLIHKSVHRLVAEAFIENNRVDRDQINHKDGDKTNNSVENLEWCTNKENIDHSVRMNLINPNPPKGENAVFAKLTDNQVCMMRQLYSEQNYDISKLAKDYGVTICTANNAIFGRSYKSADAIYPPCTKRKTKSGSDSPYSTLLPEDIITIRARYSNGETQTKIAEDYNVSISTIWRIVNNLRYNN